MKISIVTAFYNRQSLLDKTIESLHKSEIKDYELIVVDDASVEPLQCDEAKIITVDKKDKWYTCSAVAFNRGLREATGDVIIIQNPECYHVGDVLKYVQENIREGLYLSFACYAINASETASFHLGKMPVIQDKVVDNGNGWYNHTVHRPVAYHFCSAIMRKDLDRIGGFDERYSRGVAFDDDDFIRYIKQSKMIVKIVNNPFVIHQFHTHFEMSKPSAWRPYHDRNLALFNQGYIPNVLKDYSRNTITFPSLTGDWNIINQQYNKLYRDYTGSRDAAIPRKFHMIWLGGYLPLKYIRLIDKCIALHPKWEFKIWTDRDVTNLNLINREAYEKTENKGVKSALLRYEILYQYGGVYADLDFEWIKPIDDLLYLDFFGGGRDTARGIDKPILSEGLMGCTPQNDFLATIIGGINKKQNTVLYDTDSVTKEFCSDYITKAYLQYIKDTDKKCVLFPDAFFYPMPSSFKEEIREDTPENRSRIATYIKPQTYCVHLWHGTWLPPKEEEPIIIVPPRPTIHVKAHQKLNRRIINREKKRLNELKKQQNGLDSGR